MARVEFKRGARKTLRGTVRSVRSHEGTPGDPNRNNNQIRLHMENGSIVKIDAYSGGSMQVSVTKPSK